MSRTLLLCRISERSSVNRERHLISPAVLKQKRVSPLEIPCTKVVFAKLPAQTCAGLNNRASVLLPARLKFWPRFSLVAVLMRWESFQIRDDASWRKHSEELRWHDMLKAKKLRNYFILFYFWFLLFLNNASNLQKNGSNKPYMKTIKLIFREKICSINWCSNLLESINPYLSRKIKGKTM